MKIHWWGKTKKSLSVKQSQATSRNSYCCDEVGLFRTGTGMNRKKQANWKQGKWLWTGGWGYYQGKVGLVEGRRGWQQVSGRVLHVKRWWQSGTQFIESKSLYTHPVCGSGGSSDELGGVSVKVAFDDELVSKFSFDEIVFWVKKQNRGSSLSTCLWLAKFYWEWSDF